MILYDYRCGEGHIAEHLVSRDERDTWTPACDRCGGPMVRCLTFGGGMLWAEEGRPRVIENLGHEPVVITSPRQHREAMHRAGVDWTTAGRGKKGCWV